MWIQTTCPNRLLAIEVINVTLDTLAISAFLQAVTQRGETAGARELAGGDQGIEARFRGSQKIIGAGLRLSARSLLGRTVPADFIPLK